MLAGEKVILRGLELRDAKELHKMPMTGKLDNI